MAIFKTKGVKVRCTEVELIFLLPNCEYHLKEFVIIRVWKEKVKQSQLLSRQAN